MSLDVYLRANAKAANGSGIFVREDGRVIEITRAEWDEKFPGREPVIVESQEDDCVFTANITHNLGRMAEAADLYRVLWRPDENGITHADQLIEPLRAGLARLQADPVHFKQFNPSNGWGDFDGLVAFVSRYLAACERWPAATVSVWR